MYTELIHIRNALLRISILFFVLVLLFLTTTVPPLHGTVAEWAIEQVHSQLIPAGATLAVMTPLDPFLAQATVAAALAVALLIPYFLWEVWQYLAPALLPRERRALFLGLLGGLFLSLLGGVFAYRVLIPLMFTELYGFLPLGVAPLFNLRSVLSQVVDFTLGTALMFLLPLFMILLTWVGLIKANIWLTYTRHVVLLVIVVSAIITPDGSGVGMTLLAVPICALYGVGCIGTTVVAKRHSTLTR